MERHFFMISRALNARKRKIFALFFALAASIGLSYALTPKGTDVWDDATKTLTVNSNPQDDYYNDQGEIKRLVISSSVTEIGEQAFSSSYNLQEVIAYDGLQVIDQSAFFSCPNLVSVILPSTLREVRYSAFSYCDNLKYVTINASSLEDYAEYAFDDTHADLKIYVPEASVATYKYFWPAYADKIVAIGSDEPAAPAKPTLTLSDKVSILGMPVAGITDLGTNNYEIEPGTQFQIQAAVPEHYNFVGWSDLDTTDPNYSANPRTVTINSDLTIKPLYALEAFTITLTSNDTTMGTLTMRAGSGGGEDGDMAIANNADLEGANTSRNIAVGADGSIHVVYKSTEDQSVKYIKSIDGVTFTEPVTVANGARECEVAVSSNGRVYVSYYKENDGGYIAYSADGTNFTNVKVDDNAASIHLATDGDYVYGVNMPGMNFYYSSDGGQTYNMHSGWSGYMFSDVMVDPLNHNVVVIKDMPEVVVRYSTDHGATFTEEAPVMVQGENDQLAIFFSTATMGDGKVYMAGAGAFVAIIDYKTATCTKTDVNSTDNRSLCADPVGNVIVGVEQGGNLYYQLSTNSAVSFGDKVLVSNGSGANAALNYHDGTLLYLFTKDNKLYLATRTGIVPTESVVDNGDGTYAVQYGTEVTFTAKAKPGYHVESWSNAVEVNDIIVATQTLEVNSAMTIGATFAANPILTIATNDSTKGIVSLEGAGGSGQGAEAAEINPDMAPQSWQGDETLITVNDLPGFGSMSEADALEWGLTSAIEGMCKLIYAEADGGQFKFMDFYNGGYSMDGVSFMDRDRIYSTLSEGIPVYYAIGGEAIEGIIDLGGGQYSVVPGTELTFVAKPAEEHYLVSWNGEAATSDTLKLTMNGELAVNASFAHVPYIYTLPEGVSIVEPLPAGITAKGNGVYEVAEGTEFQIQAAVPEHHSFGHWADLADTAAMYAANPRTIVAGENLTIEPIFAIDTYTLTLATNDSTKGVVSVKGAGSGAGASVGEMISLSEKQTENPVMGEYFQVAGEGVNYEGRIIGRSDDYQLTISSQNGEKLDFIILKVSSKGLWSGYTVSSTAGDVEDLLDKFTIRVSNINATSVTISRSGTTGNPTGYIIVSNVYVNEEIPLSVDITDRDFPNSGNVLTGNGVTLTAGSFDLATPQIVGGGTFTTDLGNFTKIEIYAMSFSQFSGEGWTEEVDYARVWTGNASSVSFDGAVIGQDIESIYIAYTIAPASAASGIVDNGDGTYTVDYGTELTFVAKPAENHYLVSWNGEPATSDTLKLTMNGELAVNATFAHVPYTITLPEGVSIVGMPIDGITAKGEGVYEIVEGTEFQISADIIPEHYHFDHWADLDAEDAMYAANPRTIVASENLTVEPFYAIDTYTLTLATNDSTMGVVSLEGAGAGQDEGEGVDIVWDADFWNGIQAYMNGEDYVHANNSKDGITITFDGGDFENGLKDGKIKLDNSDNKLIFTSTVGKIKKIEIRGYASYKPEGWSRDGGLMWEGTPSDVVELFGQATFVHFVSATFTIEPDATTGKIVDNGDGTYTVDYGTELTFVAKPAEGFMLDSWSNGAEVTSDTLKLTMTEELSLTANFKHIPATITLPEGVSIVEPMPAGITSKGEGVYEVEYGTEFQISADSIPAHYHFDHWADLADSVAMYAANPRTIVAGENLTIEPIFAIDTYTLTLATNDSTMGTLSVAGIGEEGGLQEPSAQLIVPESWSSEVGVTITAADLPGFVASTEEAVKALPVPTEGSVFVIYNFKDNGGVEAVTFENGEYVRTTSTPVDHANASYYSNQGMIFLYTTAAGQAGQGGEGEELEGEPVSVTIGDLTTAQVSDYLPACTMTNYAYSQQIYMANEIGGAGKITAITYWLMNNSNYTRNYEIYMKEVSESAFASNDAWVLLSESDKVASYALANDTDEPVAKTITLNAPFEYSGNGNLMIAIRDITGQWSDGAKGLVNDVNGNKALYSFRDSKAYDVADPAGTGLLYAKRNVVKIDMIAAPKPASGIVDNGDGTYIVDWGTEITIVATPAEDYHLVSWSNGAAVTEDNKQIVTVENELSVSAFFKHDTYILTVEGAEVEIAKFADGTTDAVVLNPGTLVGVQEGDSVKLTTTATFSSADIADNLDITLHYAIEVIDGGIYDNEYALAITDSIYAEKGFILEPMTPDKDAAPEEQEAENEEGFEIYAYGYCRGDQVGFRFHLNSGNPDQYKIDFADSRFTDIDWTDLEISGKDGEVFIDIPVDMPTGDYQMTVTFRDSRFTFIESNPLPVTFHVNLPETYVVALFDDVMAVVDTCECLTDIQWYWRANSTDQWTAIEGATGYYYKQEGGLSGEYFIKAKMNGIDTYTCPQDDMSLYGDNAKAKVRAYPNPVVNATMVTIENSRAYEHNLRIINLMGSEMFNASFEGTTTTVEMGNYPQGHYMISVDGITVKVMKQ